MAEGKRKRTATARSTSEPSVEERRLKIEEVAYFKAAARGFVPGFEEQDWLEAEREVERTA
jgi:hypothetical protein